MSLALRALREASVTRETIILAAPGAEQERALVLALARQTSLLVDVAAGLVEIVAMVNRTVMARNKAARGGV